MPCSALLVLALAADRRLWQQRQLDGDHDASAAGSTTTGSGPSTVSTTTTTATVGDGASTPSGVFDARKLYADAAPGVVTILSIFGDPNSLGGSGGQGSGFVISNDGEIATDAHVVTDAEQTGGSGGPLHAADQVYVEFPDRNQVEAKIVGFDPDADVALLKVNPDGLDLQPLKLGSSSAVQVGTPVAAIGSPFGEEQSLSVGIVSATDRSIDSLTKFKIDGAIQTDASINPGNSGGPLIDPQGEVIGINQQINTTSGGNEGVGFAVPSDLVKRSLADLRDDGHASYPFVGVSTVSLYPQLADKLGIDAPTGALVVKTVDGSPAADAGIRGTNGDSIEFQGRTIKTGGDVITAVDGTELKSETDVSRLIAQHEPGDKITLDIIRDGKHQQVEVTLAARPQD